MREMQRNNDRALSNIEAIPGGFNHLRRMYSTIQEPMESAISPAGSEEANERLARQLNVESVPEQSLNTQALPNPWSQQQANNSDHSNSSNTPRQQQQTMSQNPFACRFFFIVLDKVCNSYLCSSFWFFNAIWTTTTTTATSGITSIMNEYQTF